MKPAGYLLAVVAAWLIAGIAAGANDAIATARKLYAEAAYERALAAMEQAGSEERLSADDAQTLQRIRALCFLALERTSEAIQTVDELVRLDPLLSPDPSDPPKLRTLIEDARTRLLPGILRERYARGRAHFERQAFTEARMEFDAVLAILDRSGAHAGGTPEAADLRLLTTSFLDLLSARSEPAASAIPAAVPDTPSGESIDTPADPVAAVAIEQRVPPWPNALRKWLTTRREGMLELRVGTDGAVESAALPTPIHVAYDRLLLAAAMTWKYRPAMRNGKPIPSTKFVRVVIPPAADPPEHGVQR